MGFLGVQLSGLCFLYLLLDSFPSVFVFCFVQFRCASFYFMLLHLITIFSNETQKGVDLYGREVGESGIEGGQRCYRSERERIYFSIKGETAFQDATVSAVSGESA